MHDGMQCDSIQRQGQRHEPLKVGNPWLRPQMSPEFVKTCQRAIHHLSRSKTRHSPHGNSFCHACAELN